MNEEDVDRRARVSHRAGSSPRRSDRRTASNEPARTVSRDRRLPPLSRAGHEGRIRTRSPRRTRSTSTQGSVRIARERAGFSDAAFHNRNHVVNGNSTESEAGEMTGLSQVARQQRNADLMLFKPSESELLSDASAFYYSKVGRRCLHKLHDRAVQLRQAQSDLTRIAVNYDSHILLRQSILQLRDSLSDKSFWNQQERRADRARDLFLLTKAFTHWAQTASDEVFRTSVARRHILRTRYFNAWRDITAVNELKSRRLGLRKWFAVWLSLIHISEPTRPY